MDLKYLPCCFYKFVCSVSVWFITNIRSPSQVLHVQIPKTKEDSLKDYETSLAVRSSFRKVNLGCCSPLPTPQVLSQYFPYSHPAPRDTSWETSPLLNSSESYKRWPWQVVPADTHEEEARCWIDDKFHVCVKNYCYDLQTKFRDKWAKTKSMLGFAQSHNGRAPAWTSVSQSLFYCHLEADGICQWC